MVKRSRDQSQEAPSRTICFLIVSPLSSFHFQTRRSNSARPTCWRVSPSAASWRSTITCVPMPAWSVPGSHKVLNPCIRFQRTSASIWVCSSMCPMCSDPVTLGGGMTMENMGLVEAAPSPSARNRPRSTHTRAHFRSISAGS